MRWWLVLLVAALALAPSAVADDVRFRRPDDIWIPGYLGAGDYATLTVATLPDIITATVESLNPQLDIASLNPLLTVEKP